MDITIQNCIAYKMDIAIQKTKKTHNIILQTLCV